METLYTGHIHGFPPATNVSVGSTWASQGGIVALGVVLGSSISLVGLAFAFITYSLFSDLRSLAGTALLSLLASLFMGQLLFVIGVGGIQDAELCLSLSLALLFMKLAALCWLCCCCHHSLTLFRSNANLIPRPEAKMGRALAHYSLLSWGFPLIMVAVAAAFEYKENEHHSSGQQTSTLIITELNTNNNCWLMKGSGYIFGFLIPSSILLFVGLYMAFTAKKIAKISAGMQIDSRVRNKLEKRRGLQINLFIRILLMFATVVTFGAIASLRNSTQFWSMYSIAQGVQGIVTTLLVTCNCKILKLYTTPRLHKNRKGKYSGLQEGEGGRYGVLSVTNPNYADDADVTGNDADSSFVKMNYNEDSLIERSESKDSTTNLNGDLINALAISELSKTPLPQSV
ncbi:adhesion G protein-coupled receptor L4-like [Bradysia coprophila]|uniref:adhesion G protein-coupled receptor L4-like n=1 Tax=Bradysia coprophila TaxID=38358 RepID=UPI00187D9044|nr:adhesion G protein-coupled receptor L4-like [Bradysia coprophila]